MTDQPASLAEALAVLQTQLPSIAKDADAQYGKYADLAGVSKALLPVIGELGLSFSARPTIIVREDGTRDFVLAYVLRHTCGESDGGDYPLPSSGSPQQIGSAITYARRYTLCAVTGAVADEDDDGAAAETAAKPRARRAAQQRPASEREKLGKPPERAPGNLPRNADGSISRSQATDEELAAAGLMTDSQQREHGRLAKDVQGGSVNGVSRATEADPDDQWHDAPPPPLRAPRAAKNSVTAIRMHFDRLGVTDRAERLRATARIAGREELTTTNDLTAAEGVKVLADLGKCKDRGALIALLAKEVVDA